MRPFLAVALAAALAATAAAQEPSRDRGFGRVTHADGSAWADAEVHLVHRSHPSLDAPADGEQLLVRSDERGEFRAELLVGVTYLAWALGPVDEQGSYAVSDVVADAVSRTPILLREGERQFVRRVKPAIDASWPADEPLRWRCVQRGGAEQWLAPDADGVLTLPRHPGDAVVLQAWAGSWQVFHSYCATTSSYARQRGAETKVTPPADDAEAAAQLTSVRALVVPPRRERVVLLRDEVTQAPLADVETRFEPQPGDLAPPRSDADGRLTIVFAHADEAPQRLPYRTLLLTDGHAEYTPEPSSWQAGAPPELTRDLPPGRTLRGRVLWNAEEPVVDVPLLLDGSIGTSSTSTWFGVGPRVFHTDEHGAFALPGRCERFPFRLTAALSPAMRARLGRGDDAWPVAPHAVLAWEQTGLPEAIGDLELSTLRTLDLRVTEPDGSPPGPTRVLLTRLGVGPNAPARPFAALTDRRGRVRILASEAEDLLVHVTTERGALWQRLDANAREVTLQVDARHVVEFELVDQNGAPLADTEVMVVGPESLGGEHEQVRSALHSICSVNAIAHRKGSSDARGRGQLVAPMLDVSLDLVVRDDAGLSERVMLPWRGPEGDGPVRIAVTHK